MNALVNKAGITIRELKELVKNLPETNSEGENYEVWVENTDDPFLSNVAKSILQLNVGYIIISRNV